jgi:quercetin dioxygenase-like cupin family protein
MRYADEDINVATDARTNAAVAPMDFTVRAPQDLAKLRARWAELPSTPKLLARREEGEDHSWPGFDVRTLLRGEESSGRFSFHSVILAPGAELPPHYHEIGDVYWFLVDGEIELTVGSQTTALRPWSFGFAPAQTTQAVANRSAKPAHVFAAYSPAGAGCAFASLHQLWREKPDSDPAAYRQLLTDHGFQFTAGTPLPNDVRTNQEAPRVDARIERLDDFLALRERWRQLRPVPKIVPDPRTCYNLSMMGEENHVILNPEEAGGAASVFFSGGVEPFAAPPHHQPTEEEFFIILEGAMRLTIGNKTVEEALPGAFGFAPRFGTHAFSNARGGRGSMVRMFNMNAPGGHDRGFELAVKERSSPRFGELIAAHGFQFHSAS